MSVYSFLDCATISSTCTLLGKGAGSTSLDYSTAFGTTIIGAGSAVDLVDGSENTIVGDGVSIASSCGRATVIGNNATCAATSGTSNVILIGNDASISATHTNVCVFGGQSTNTPVLSYGRGPLLYIPITTKGADTTLTGAEVLSGLILFTNGSFICTFPTEQTIFDAMVDPVVGSGTRLFIRKNTSSTLTLVTLNLSDYKGPPEITSGEAYYFYFVVKSTSPVAFYVRASKTTINA
jgi:hypothetical protein